VLRSFFKDGFDRGERAAHIVEADKREDYLRRLVEADINVQEMMDAGQLEVLPRTDMYVRDHRFDQDAMLASVEELIQSGASAGYPRTRLVGHHMDWLFLDQPAVNNLVEYEARLNHVLSKYSAPVICNYDQSNSAQAWRWTSCERTRSSLSAGCCGRIRSSFHRTNSWSRYGSVGCLCRKGLQPDKCPHIRILVFSISGGCSGILWRCLPSLWCG
jgi:hypothetical protein